MGSMHTNGYPGGLQILTLGKLPRSKLTYGFLPNLAGPILLIVESLRKIPVLGILSSLSPRVFSSCKKGTAESVRRLFLISPLRKEDDLKKITHAFFYHLVDQVTD